MNNLVIPPSPNWYEASIMACAPDNTIIYGARNDLVFIQPSRNEGPAKIKIISRAHSQKVISVCLNKNWGQPNKLAVTVAEDKILKLWNVDLLEKQLSHNGHIAHEKVIGASFAGDDRIISVSENGIIIIWNINLNETNVIKDIFGFKVTVTCISTCPHATWITAFGLKSGLVIICDLRRNGKVLHKLRSHDKPVISLAWCPVPINIFPKNPQNYVGIKRINDNEEVKEQINSNMKLQSQVVKVDEIEDLISHNKNKDEDVGTDIIENGNRNFAERVSEIQMRDCNFVRRNDDTEIEKKTNIEIKNEEGCSEEGSVQHEFHDNADKVQTVTKEYEEKKKLKNPWANLVHADDDECPKEAEHSLLNNCNSNDNFLAECKQLKSKIMGIKTVNVEDTCVSTSGECHKTIRPVLKAKKNKKNITECGEGYNCKENVDGSPSLNNSVEENVFEVQETNKYKMNEQEVEKQAGNVPPSSIKNISNEDNLLECHKLVHKEEMSEKGSFTEEETACIPNDSRTIEEHVEKYAETTLTNSNISIKNVVNKKNVFENLEPANNEELSSTDDKTTYIPIGDNTITECLNVKNILDKHIINSEKKNNGKILVEENKDIVFEHQRTIDLKTSSGENHLTCKDVGRVIVHNEIVSKEEEPRKEFLLASSARESRIYIWRAGTDGRMETFLTLPKAHSRKGGKSVEKLWIPLCWAAPNKLLSSSKFNELLEWTLPKPRNESQQVRLIHKDHTSLLFSIAVPVVYSKECNWQEEKQLNAWTAGMDRLLLNTDLGKERKNLDCYPTLGGCVSCFSSSPVDPARLAFGTGEGIINGWDLSRPHARNIVMTNFYQKIQSKVTALAWHPSNEMLLAYGTIEGRIGSLNTISKSKMPSLLSHYFKTTIHKIEWGPFNDDKSEFALYAVAEGKLVFFDLKKPEAEPSELDTPDNTVIYTFAWKPDYSKLLVSTKSGCVIMYSSDLKIVSTYYLHQKLQYLVWHPDSVNNDTYISKYCNCFAAVEKSTTCVIYDLNIHSDDGIKVVAKCTENDGVINSLAWSPHDGNKIVLASEEGIAQVYDIESKTKISTFVHSNFDSLLAVIWSPIDPNFILTGSRHHVLSVWKISENFPLSENEVTQIRNKVMKAISKEASDLLPKVEATEEVKPKVKKNTKNSLLPYFYSPKEAVQIVADLKKLLLWKNKDVFAESQMGDEKYADILQVFGDSTEMRKIINKNQIMHKQRGKFLLSNTLSLLKGDISTEIKDAIEEKRVTPWIISLAPMVSPKLWQTACEAYAQQLLDEADSDPLETVTYLLACHRIQEAVNVLCNNHMFREALALAKSRMPENDSVVTSVIEKWAKHASMTGNFEFAAQCYVYLDQYEEAATILFRRSDADILKLAAELAEKSGNQELHKAVLFRYNAFKVDVKACDVSFTNNPTVLDNVQIEPISLEEPAEIGNDKENSETKGPNKDAVEDSIQDKESGRHLVELNEIVTAGGNNAIASCNPHDTVEKIDLQDNKGIKKEDCQESCIEETHETENEHIREKIENKSTSKKDDKTIDVEVDNLLDEMANRLEFESEIEVQNNN